MVTDMQDDGSSPVVAKGVDSFVRQSVLDAEAIEAAGRHDGGAVAIGDALHLRNHAGSLDHDDDAPGLAQIPTYRELPEGVAHDVQEGRGAHVAVRLDDIAIVTNGVHGDETASSGSGRHVAQTLVCVFCFGEALGGDEAVADLPQDQRSVVPILLQDGEDVCDKGPRITARVLVGEATGLHVRHDGTVLAR
jgi:hypothetical protein